MIPTWYPISEHGPCRLRLPERVQALLSQQRQQREGTRGPRPALVFTKVDASFLGPDTSGVVCRGLGVCTHTRTWGLDKGGASVDAETLAVLPWVLTLQTQLLRRHFQPPHPAWVKCLRTQSAFSACPCCPQALSLPIPFSALPRHLLCASLSEAAVPTQFQAHR
jgi:hypothetical protein